ncbi:MAG: hypothetical protein H6931_01980 [Burkholderiaceae bacterium]|nr:hypothetical protein [Burkholderiaceae bacterium]
MQLNDARSPHSPQRVLEIVRRIQLHQVTLPNQERAVGVGELDPIQRDLETLGSTHLHRLETAV